MIYWVGGASGVALLIYLGLVVLRWRMGTVQAQRFVLRDGRRQVVAQLAAGYKGGELELRDARERLRRFWAMGCGCAIARGRCAPICGWATMARRYWSSTTSAAGRGPDIR